MQRTGMLVIMAATIGIAIVALVSGITRARVTSYTIFSGGIILGAHAPFTVTGVDGVYIGRNNITGQTTSGSDAVTVITTVFGWMSSGQSVELIGTFTWTRMLTLTKSITMDCTQATITATEGTSMGGPVTAFDINGKLTLFGGSWIGTPSGENALWALFHSSASYSVIDSGDFKNFGFFFGYGGTAGPGHITFQNCSFHDRAEAITMGGGGNGYNIIQDCHFLNNIGDAIYFSGGCTNCQILRCEIGYQSGSPTAGAGHAIYLSGGDGSGGTGGHHTIAGCTFHDAGSYAGALHIKCPHNKIYNNTFYNGRDTVAISIYSQWTGTQANDNEVYNNTFTDMESAIWIGNPDVDVEPTLRNLIYNNTFTRVIMGIWQNGRNATADVEDTKVYYNDFTDCQNPFYSSTPSLIHNTVVAYNYFNATVSPTQLQSMVDSMSYQNTLFPPNDTTLAIPSFNYSLILDPTSYYYVPPRTA